MNDTLSQIKKAFLYLVDIAIFYGVLWLVLLLRYGGDFNDALWKQHLWPFTTVFALWMIVFYISGLYDSRVTKNDFGFYALVLRSVAIGAVLGIVYFYIFSDRTFNIKPQVVYLIYVSIFVFVFLLWRRAFNSLVKIPVLLHSVLFVGNGKTVDELVAELDHKPMLGYVVAEKISADDLRAAGQDPVRGDLHRLLSEKKIDTVVMSPEVYASPEAVEKLYQNLALGIKYYDLSTFYEKAIGRVPVNTIGQMWFLENISENEKKLYEALKRVMEIITTLALAVIGAVLSPFIALAIKLNSRGPVLFVQDRVGRDGRVFRAMKFRSMVVGAEKSGAQWAQENDPRVTRVGGFLRKTRLDEIPQLLNVLKGEMSFIGPRPERPEFVAELTRKIPFYGERHLIKPGLTGWAQVNFPYGASEEDALQKLQYDLYYVKNRSLFLDFSILLKTVNIVLSRQGR
jgi:exopolysaccharide biosynthesis polyprenyl glycosylphosphotransferase